MSDSGGYVYDPNGINVDIMKDIKLKRRARITTYADEVKTATYTPDCRKIWSVKCDIALPCATQNEIDRDSAEQLIANGVKVVSEGANMPCNMEATKAFLNAGVLFGPAKAANAGGVAVSGLEMTQNSMRLSWTFEDVDANLHGIMKSIFNNISSAAREYSAETDLVTGANIAGFLKVSEAMLAQGVV
jgi:glutamate dehydrogenase (NADP+)